MGTLLAVLYAAPLTKIRSAGAFTASDFLLMLFVPAILAALAFYAQLLPKLKPIREILHFAAAVCDGVALGLVVCGYLVVYEWYVDPSRPHLEPLFVALGLGAASAFGCSKLIRSIIKKTARTANEPAMHADRLEP